MLDNGNILQLEMKQIVYITQTCSQSIAFIKSRWQSRELEWDENAHSSSGMLVITLLD